MCVLVADTEVGNDRKNSSADPNSAAAVSRWVTQFSSSSGCQKIQKNQNNSLHKETAHKPSISEKNTRPSAAWIQLIMAYKKKNKHILL